MPNPTLLSRATLNFDAYLSRWDIHIPRNDIQSTRPGFISKAGWSVWYTFGINDRGPYMDTYTSHRMTDDSHQRFYESGESEHLPTLSGICRRSRDPQEDKRLAEEHFAKQQQISEMLDAKGFGARPEMSPLDLVNRALGSGKVKNES